MFEDEFKESIFVPPPNEKHGDLVYLVGYAIVQMVPWRSSRKVRNSAFVSSMVGLKRAPVRRASIA